MKKGAVSVNGSIVGKGKESFLVRHRKLIMASMLVLLLTFICTFVWQRHKSAVSRSVCYQQIPQAISLLKNPQGRKLLDLGQQIEKIPGYKSDVNCLYVVTQGYISVSDPDKSRESYNLLTKVYKENMGYNKEFDSVVTLPYQLDEIIKNLEQQSQVQPTGTFFVEDE